MAGVVITYAAGRFSWTFTQGSVPATELRLKWGTSPGVYTQQKVYGVSTTGAAVNTVLPAGSVGQFYSVMVAAHATGEGVPSAEVPFVLSAGPPNGTWVFRVE